MADLRFTEKDPNKGYLTNQLLIPKHLVNRASLINDLTFYIGETTIYDEDGRPLRDVPKAHELWDETEHHMVVPRAFFTKQMRDDFTREFGIEWIEERLESKQVVLPDTIIPNAETQELALEAMFQHRGGTVNLACGKGKTIIALKYGVMRQTPVLVVVNSSLLLDQWVRKIKSFIGEDVEVGQVQGTVCRWRGYPITIATVQTLSNRRDSWPMEFRRHFGVIFFDEGHHMAAPHFVKAADLFFGERFSLTATPFRNDGLQEISMYHIGEIIYQDMEQDLIPDSVFHFMEWKASKDHDFEARDVNSQIHHRKLCIMLGTIDWRNRVILRRLEEDMEEGRQILVLTHSVEHTRRLGEMAYAKWKTTGVVNGPDVPPKDRIPVVEATNPVIATFDLAREALDKPELDTLHVGTPFGNSNDLQQAWGRIQRHREGKNDPRVRVYEDRIWRPTDSSSMSRSSSDRIRTCENQCNDLRKFLKALKYPSRKEKEETPWTSQSNPKK